MRIAVSSQNPNKVTAVRDAASQAFNEEIILSTHKVASGVHDQPLGINETYTGAYNRAHNTRDLDPQASLAVGIEGGMMEVGDYRINFGFAYVLGRSGLAGIGMTPGHAVPQPVIAMIDAGQELSEAVEHYYATDTVEDRDCSGVITEGLLPSAEAYRQSVALALQDYLQKLKTVQP